MLGFSPSDEFLKRRSGWQRYATSTGVSVLLHVIALVACSLMVFEQTRLESIFSSVIFEETVEPEPIVERGLDMPADPGVDSLETPDPLRAIEDVLSDATSTLPLDINDMAPSVSAGGNLDVVGIESISFGDETSGRSRAARSALVKRFGGNTASEAAVASGLRWIANHQLEDGSWSFDHKLCKTCDGKCSQPGNMGECRSAATGLALLAFLGGGHTQKSGDYQQTVQRGVDALIKLGKVSAQGVDFRGELASGHGHAAYYAQGIATIALCESYALTKDPQLKTTAQGALSFIINTQDPKGGGWRYEPRQEGDTSVVGWQVMALKSGQNAKLTVPGPTFRGAEKFLNSVASENGSQYAYLEKDKPTPSTSAIGLLCRMYLGWNRREGGLRKGIVYLDRTKPSRNNMYYNYYATQVLHHWGGEEWTRWNDVMRDQLVKSQKGTAQGHMAGSWDLADPHGASGGRLYMTCLAVMTLEVYYRHLPIYQREKIKVEF